MNKYISFIIITLISACSSGDKQISVSDNSTFHLLPCKYAKLFGFKVSGNDTQVYVIDEGDTLFYHRKQNSNSLSSFIVMSTVFAGFLEELGLQNTILGVDRIQYYSDSELLDMYSQRKVLEFGDESVLSHEQILSNAPEYIITSGSVRNFEALIKKLKGVNSSLISCQNYKETHPLARAEWIRFFGFLSGYSRQADSVFNNIENQYLSIKSNLEISGKKPVVLTEAVFSGSWNIPGAGSYTATLIRDAGGKYVFEDKKTDYTFPLSLESVLERADTVDIWINSGHYKSMQELKSADKRYELVHAFQNKRIYNNNKLENRNGGNPYWERGVARPDIILRDLAIIFGTLKNTETDLFFYKRLD